jgi:hypothetical protein
MKGSISVGWWLLGWRASPLNRGQVVPAEAASYPASQPRVSLLAAVSQQSSGVGFRECRKQVLRTQAEQLATISTPTPCFSIMMSAFCNIQWLSSSGCFAAALSRYFLTLEDSRSCGWCLLGCGTWLPGQGFGAPAKQLATMRHTTTLFQRCDYCVPVIEWCPFLRMS